MEGLELWCWFAKFCALFSNKITPDTPPPPRTKKNISQKKKNGKKEKKTSIEKERECNTSKMKVIIPFLSAVFSSPES